jgi:hypothetical protein
MHPAKKLSKEKDPLRYSKLSGNNTSATKTTLEIQALLKQRLQEGNSAQSPSSLDQRSWVFTLKIVLALKTMPSTRTLPDTIIKARPWIFILKGKTLNFTCVAAPTCILLL